MKVTSPIYRPRSYIPTLQPSIVTLKTAANAEHQRITWNPKIFLLQIKSENTYGDNFKFNRWSLNFKKAIAVSS